MKFKYCSLFQVILTILIVSSCFCQSQSFSGDCQILYQCQLEAIKLIESPRNTGYHGLGLSWSSSTCGVIRQKLGCIINLAESCPSRDNLTIKPTWSIVQSARNYLVDKCSSNRDWSDSSCFQNPQIKECEAGNDLKPEDINLESCRKYQNYKKCIINHVTSKCSFQDQEFVLVYLIGKAVNMTWLCSNANFKLDQPLMIEDPYGSKNPYGNHIDKRGSSNFDQPPQLNDQFQSDSANADGPDRPDRDNNGLWYSNNRFPPDFFRPTEPVRQNLFRPNGQRGLGVEGHYRLPESPSFAPLPPIQGPVQPQGQPSQNPFPNERYYGERGQGPGEIFPPNNGLKFPHDPMGLPEMPNKQLNFPMGPSHGDLSRVDSCLQRANMIGRHCEEALNEGRHLGREARRLNDGKSSHCCGLLRYSDCFGKIVDQVCPNIDASSVYRSIPENRRQDMASCQSYGPFNCDYGNTANNSNPSTILFSILVLFFLYQIN